VSNISPSSTFKPCSLRALLSAKDLDKNGYGLQANEVRGEILRTSEKINRVILNNQNCFTPQQVGQAQTYIASIE
jgi:hypothetical protein